MFKSDKLKGEYSYLLLSAKTPCMFVDKIGALTIPKLKEYKTFLEHLEKNMKRLVFIHTQVFDTQVPIYIYVQDYNGVLMISDKSIHIIVRCYPG